MHKRNLEILRLQVALQDFAEFEIVIYDEQMRLGLLRLPAGNFLCLCNHCVLIVHDGCEESLLNQDRLTQSNPNEEMLFPTVLCRVPANNSMQLRADRPPTICSLV